MYTARDFVGAGRLNIQQYAEEAMHRLVVSPDAHSMDWRGVVEQGLAAAYQQTDAIGLTSMVHLVTQLLDGAGRFEDAIGEVDHGLAFARTSPDATVILIGLKAVLFAASGRMEQALLVLPQAEPLLEAAGEPARIQYEVHRQTVCWQTLGECPQGEAEALIARASAAGMTRERGHLTSWYIPYLAAIGERRGAHPWIRQIRLESDTSGSLWRAGDVAAFDAWDEFTSQSESRAARGVLKSANSLAAWRGAAIRLRESVLRRDAEAVESSLDSLERMRRRLGNAAVGDVEQFRHAATAPTDAFGHDFGSKPPVVVHLNNLGATLADAEAAATHVSQLEAGEWLSALTEAVPSHVASSLEWPVSVARIRGLLALRAGDTRRARKELEQALEWSKGAGFTVEEGLARLQLGELCASVDLRVPERTWSAERRAGAEILRRCGYDPMPHAYVVAHGVTIAGRGITASRLTPREVQVLGLLARGLTYKVAGENLGIAGPTVQTLAHRIYHKLGASGRMKAVEEGRRLGIL